MPAWEFLGPEKIAVLIAYVQSLGFKKADQRMARQTKWKRKAVAAYESGPDENVAWLHSMVPEGWRKLPNPYPATEASLARGKKIYQSFCIGCHGPVGDGMGPAEPFLYPPPLNFTILGNRGITGGILYYQIMNGITGTAMPYFKESWSRPRSGMWATTWPSTFIGETDANSRAQGDRRGLWSPWSRREGSKPCTFSDGSSWSSSVLQ